jgi:adenylate cyclase
MAKILVVDDEPDLEALIKQKFRQRIRQNKYEFVFACNGLEALEILKADNDIDLVLSDINMPGMDGLTLLTKIGEQKGLLKSVIVSAYGDMENIRIAMNRGAFDFITKPIDFQDLEITIDKTLAQVYQMKETLRAIKENSIFRLYVDETVLNFMGGGEFEHALIQNETTEGSVAFIDICGFTAISETLPPNKVVGLLNTYFDIMVEEILKENGTVDKFMGDAVMAVFKGEFHLDRALDACLSIRNTINKQGFEVVDSVYRPQVSIGINSGEMVSGNIGSHTLRKLDYTVIGDVVNVAARLQSEAQVGQILITEENYNKVKESFECHRIGEVLFKNKKLPIVIYEVAG